MHTLTHSLLSRIPLVHLAADRDYSYPVLAGALLKSEGGKFLIAATDGKLLIEESYDMPTLGDFSVVLSADGVAKLAGFLKLTVNKKCDVEFSFAINGHKAITISHASGAAVVLPLVEGTYPNFSGTFDKPATPQEHVPLRFCANGDYATVLRKVMGTKQSAALVYEWHHNHLQVTPLNPTYGQQRAILMPISLPERA